MRKEEVAAKSRNI